jgi:hypothetical protein
LTQPVFILGVAPRCGTNYLERLLCLHPDCGLSVPLRQNNLTSVLPILAEVSSEVKRQWRDYPNWGFTPDHFDDLDRSLGAGLIDFMLSTTDERRRITELPESMRRYREPLSPFTSLPGHEAAANDRPGSLPEVLSHRKAHIADPGWAGRRGILDPELGMAV